MHLYDVPIAFALIGLAFYAVLAGADFGAGIWQLAASRGERGDRIRDHAHHAMAPVWEANHVWLIFVLTVVWTSYPSAFGSIASTLSVALFVAGIGIVLRGAAYALRAGTRSRGEQRAIDTVSAVSSIITPFALGAAVGGIASRRVPVGNAAGNLFSSWLNPTSALTGAMAVATAAYLAAVYLSADAIRTGHPELAPAFRARALVAGACAGALAIGGLVVLRDDAHPLYHGLVSGDGRIPLAVSVLAGIGTMVLVWRRRFEPARYSAALAVAAIIAGWALAQNPVFLPGLTIAQAAAGHDTLVAIVIAVVAGGVLLFPSLGLLFRLTLRGRLGHGGDGAAPAASEPVREADEPPGAISSTLAVRAAGACLVAGIGLLTVAEGAAEHAVGVVALLAFMAIGSLATLP